MKKAKRKNALLKNYHVNNVKGNIVILLLYVKMYLGKCLQISYDHKAKSVYYAPMILRILRATILTNVKRFGVSLVHSTAIDYNTDYHCHWRNLSGRGMVVIPSKNIAKRPKISFFSLRFPGFEL